MKERFASIGTLLCLAVLSCLTLGYALAIFPGVAAIRWFFKISAVVFLRLDAPSWVQAVGSILAIVAASGGIAWQIRHSEAMRSREKHEKDVALARGCLHVVRDARRAVSHTTKKMRDALRGQPMRFDAERLEEVQYILRALIAKDLPSQVVPFVLIAQREVAYSLVSTRALRDGSAVSAMRINRSQRRTDQLGRTVAALTLLVQDPLLGRDD